MWLVYKKDIEEVNRNNIINNNDRIPRDINVDNIYEKHNKYQDLHTQARMDHDTDLQRFW